MTTIAVNDEGLISLNSSSNSVLAIGYELVDYLGNDAELEVSFSLVNGATTPTPDKTIATLVWRDSVNNDVIFRIDGVVGLPIDNSASLLSRMEASEFFEFFESSFRSGNSVQDFTNGMTSCTAFNAYGSLGRLKATLPLPPDQPPVFDAETVYDIITLMEPRPSYICVPTAERFTSVLVCQRAIERLNIPLTLELDPLLDVDQACSTAEAIDANDSLVDIVWNPTLSRPREAVGIRAPRKTRPVCGFLLGQKLLRNARTNSQGIPPIATPVAGPDYPITFANLIMRPEIVLNSAAREKLAKSKVNTVMREVYSSGSLFIMSDILTTLKSENSALRLVTSAEIASYTTNGCIDILRRHMLKKMSSFLADADRDIQKFLNACATTGMLQPATDLGGKPYVFSLTPDQTYPFERVRFTLSRRPEGAVRAIIFDEDIIVQ